MHMNRNFQKTLGEKSEKENGEGEKEDYFTLKNCLSKGDLIWAYSCSSWMSSYLRFNLTMIFLMDIETQIKLKFN